MRRLKNVTVTLEPETARWARIEAAQRDTSVSRLLGDILQREMEGQASYRQAMDRYLGQTPSLHRRSRKPLPSREALHERDRLR